MPIKSEVIDRNSEPVAPLARSWPTVRCEVIPYLLSTVDAIIILLVTVLASSFYYWLAGTRIPDLAEYALGLAASVIHVVCLSRRGYYDFERAAKPDVEVGEVVMCWFTTVLLLAFLAFLFKVGISFSRGSFLLLAGIVPPALLAVRKLEKNLLQVAVTHGAIGRRNVVLIGDKTEIDSLDGRDLLALFGAGDVNSFVLTDVTEPLLQRSSDLKTLNEVARFVRKNDASEILLAVPWHDRARIDFIREQIKFLPVWVRLLPDVQVRMLTNYASSARHKVVSIEIQRAPLRATERILKRATDLVLGLVALTFFVPIIGLTAIAIKLDGPGPIIFGQYRRGFNGRPFLMFKFRTMTVQENGQNGEAITQATRNDPRVTAIGRLLRATSIDELPQLLNVVRGEMSLIGPRPHALAHDNYFEKVLEDYAFRHHVKPGITGWAQVNGLRGATPTVDLISQRVKMDLWYINNWSLWLDFQIIIRTAIEVLRKRNAY
jgi:Undecaprenyl-phosphate glucose phosphotransferase